MVRNQPVRPTGVEREFRDNETIVSKTDLKGRITYVNDIFIRVAAYSEEQLLGQPQNIIRHPDMPAAAFKVLWTQLERGVEAFSYIVNLAQDGGHYWVLAHVTPSFDNLGNKIAYHSSRRTVTRAAQQQVQAVYQRVRAAERKAGSGRRALEAGTAAFEAYLNENNYDYDRWLWSVAADEIQHIRQGQSAQQPTAPRIQHRQYV